MSMTRPAAASWFDPGANGPSMRRTLGRTHCALSRRVRSTQVSLGARPTHCSVRVELKLKTRFRAVGVSVYSRPGGGCKRPLPGWLHTDARLALVGRFL